MADDDVLTADPAVQAGEAREAAAARLARPLGLGHGLVPGPGPEPPEEDYSVLPSDREETQAGDVDIGERFRLGRINSYYRGTIAGSGRLAELARVATAPEDRLTDAERKLRPAWKKEYDGIVADLARYDLMQPWGTTLEGAAALGGALAGGMMSPESFLGAPARGATWLARTVTAAVQQGGIQAAADPVVQWLSREGGTEQEYDPWRTAETAGLGAVIGGGLHGILGELVPAARVRKLRADLAAEDEAFAGDVERQAAAGPEIPQQLPSDIAEAQAAGTAPAAPQAATQAPGQAPGQAPAPPQPSTPAPGQAPAPAAPEDASAWTKTGGQKGSNPGGTYKDARGIEWYVKTPQTEDHARNEMLANELYRYAGANVPEMKLVTLDGKPAVASRMLPSGMQQLAKFPSSGAHAKFAIDAIKRDFAADAWLANHDVIGLGRDNILVSPIDPDQVVRIDQGGALRYRAQGQPKQNFGPKVAEFETMRDPNIAPQAAQIFGPMSDQELLYSINRVLLVPEQDIRDAVAKFGPADPAEAQKLADTLIARQDDLREIRKDLMAKIAAKMQSAAAAAPAGAPPATAPAPPPASAPSPAPAPAPAPPPASAPAPAPAPQQKATDVSVVWGKSGGGKPISQSNPGAPLAPLAHVSGGAPVAADAAHLPSGAPLKSASWAKKPPANWNNAGGKDAALAKTEPALKTPLGKKPASGVIIREPDGRVWVVAPANQFGGYEHTFPKGKISPGLSPQANAIKEAFQETGLKVKITGLIGDFEGDTSITRYYWAERTGGSPEDAHWETEAVKLVPAARLFDYLNMPRDQELAKAAFGNALKPGKHGDPAAIAASAATGAAAGASASSATAAGLPADAEKSAKDWIKTNMANVHTAAEVDAMPADQAVAYAEHHGWKPAGAPRKGIPTAPGSHPALPMDQASREARAKQTGFKLPGMPEPWARTWFHGTPNIFEAFDLGHVGSFHSTSKEKAVFLSDSPKIAGMFGGGGPVFPMWTRAQKVMVIDPEPGEAYRSFTSSFFGAKIQEAIKHGYDAVLFRQISDVGGVGDQLAVLHPNLLRSIHAAFDPAEIISPKLAAIKPGKKELTPDEFDRAYREMLEQAASDMVEAQERGEAVHPGREAPAAGAAEGAAEGEGHLQAIAQRKAGQTLAGEVKRPATGVAAPAATAVTPPAPGAPGGAAASSLPGVSAALTPAAQQAKDAAIRSLQQQVTDLAKAMGLTVHEGRVQIKGALGQFNSQSDVIRIKEIPDLVAVAHEAGHAIEQKVGQDLTNAINSFAYELGPLDYEWPAQARPAEGFAEFIRHMIGNPAYAQAQAPGFMTAFRTLMQQRAPDLLKAIDSAAAAYRAYTEASSAGAIQSMIRSQAEKQQGWRSIVQGLREDGLAATVNVVMSRAYDMTLDKNSDMFRMVRDVARAVRDETGQLVDLKAADNPAILLQMAPDAARARAIADTNRGTIPYHGVAPRGPSLTDALAKAIGAPTRFGQWNEDKRTLFSVYLIARRGEYLWRRFEAGELPNPPVAFNKADAIQAMADLEAANPTFRAASDMVHAWAKEQLIKMRDAGLKEPDVIDRLLRQEFYVPFMRDMSDKPMAGGPVTMGAMHEGPGVTELIKRIKGSARDIFDPIESLIGQARLLNRAVVYNDIYLALERLSELPGARAGRFFEPVPAYEPHRTTFNLGDVIEKKLIASGVLPDDAAVATAGIVNLFGEDPLMGAFFRMEKTAPHGEPIVFYRKEGKLKAARVMAAADSGEGYRLFELLTAMPQTMGDLFSDLVGAVSHVQRAGIVTNPTFILTNYIRDQLATFLLRPGYFPILSGLKGILSEARQGEAARLYALGGGVSPGAAVAPLEHMLRNDVAALAQNGYLVSRLGPTGHLLTTTPSWEEFGKGTPQDFSRNVAEAFRGWLEFSQITEAGTRNSVFGIVYKQKLAQGLSPYEAMEEAAWQARDLLDFGRHGSHMLMAQRFIPFLNAHLQGLDKAYRTIAQPIIDRIRGDQVFASDPENFRNALMSLVKVVGVGAVLGAAWAALNRDNEAYRDASPYLKGTHVIVGIGRNMLLIPKPFELGLGFTAGEYAYQQFAQDDPRAAAMFASAAWQILEPPTDVPLFRTGFELAANKNLWSGRDIVPESLQRLEPAQQYSERTSAMAKMIGAAIGVSPIKVDYAIGGFFGNWGRDFMALSQSVDPDSPTAAVEDRVFLRRFIKDPTRTSDITTRFWDYMRRTTGVYNRDVATYDNFVKLHRDRDAADFLARKPGRERAYMILQSAARDEDGNPAFGADEKRLHPLTRAYEAVSLLNDMSRDLAANNLSRWENREPLRLTPDGRRDLLDSIRELKQMEMRNAFVIMKEPGYAGRALFDVNPVLAKIAAVAPSVADEIATRYATRRIYTTQAVAAAYPHMERALLREGSEADLEGLALDAKAEGWEFGAERVKRPQKLRTVIPGQPAAQPIAP